MGELSTWRQIARATIHRALAEAAERRLDRQAVIDLIDSSYPFGPREHYPYKVWLEERRRVLQPRSSVTEKASPAITPKLKPVPELDDWLRAHSA